MSRIGSIIPIVGWLPEYSRSHFRGDMIAGLTVGVMLIPQSMAYALLAGVPPIYGLYASVVPLVVYAMLGTSRHLAVGIMAIDCLIVVAALGSMAEPFSADYLALAFLLTLMVGVIQVIMGLARFGFVVALLSRPVISGFTAAAALTIGFSQLKNLLAIPLPRTPDIFTLMWEAGRTIGDVHLLSFAIGAIGILFLMGLRKWAPLAPGPLIAVAIGAVLVWQLRLDQSGVEIVGDIPMGLPAPALPSLGLDSIQKLFPTAITLSLVQFMTVISLGKVFAGKHRYSVDANRELVALGALNALGSLFRSVPVSGSFSRSAVSDQAGGKTAMVNVIAAVLIAITLLFLTPLFYYLPIPIFASIIMVAAFGMIDVGELKLLLRSKRVDGWIAVFTFVATLVFGIQNGVLVGILASVVAVMYRISRPNIAELGFVDSAVGYQDIARNSEALRVPGVYVVRMDASFAFSNADYLRDHLLNHCACDAAIHAVVIDASGMNDLDTTAAGVLRLVNDTLDARGVTLLFAGVKEPVMDVIRGMDLDEDVGIDHFFATIGEALVWCAERNAEAER